MPFSEPWKQEYLTTNPQRSIQHRRILPYGDRITGFPQSVRTRTASTAFKNFALRTWASARQPVAADYGLQPSTGA